LSYFKQKTCEGCLPVCLLVLAGQKITLESELDLIIGGLKKSRESYALGIIEKFTSKYKRRATIWIDNKFFLKIIMAGKNSPIKPAHKRIDLNFLNSLATPFILYLDSNILGTYYHSPHFVIVEKRLGGKFQIVDPWIGKRRWIEPSRLERGITSLRGYLKFCPLVIKLN